MSEETNFNTIVVNQLSSLIEANGVSTELKMQSKGYQITILIESIEEEIE
jgi:hypothetical protein